MAELLSFHEKTKAVTPRLAIKPTTYWVGVLRTDKRVEGPKTEEDYLWIKCHSKLTVQTIREQYKARNFTEEDIVLKYGITVPGNNVTMAELNTHDDRLIAFEAVKVSEVNERMMNTRQPLQPMNGQMQARVLSPTSDISTKTDAPQSGTIHQNGQKFIPDQDQILAHNENQPPALVQPLSAAPKLPPSLVRSSFRNSHAKERSVTPSSRGTPGIHTPQPAPAPKAGDPPWFYYIADHRRVYQQRNPTLSAAQIDNLLFQLWPQRPPREKKYYEMLAERANAFARLVKKEVTPIINNSGTPPIVKADVDRNDSISQSPKLEHRDKSPDTLDNANSDIRYDFKADDEPSESNNFQLPKLLSGCPPEVLEVGVERGVELLESLKVAIQDKTAVSSDATQWVQQINKVQKQAAKTRTVVGVVGNTGAGKSSVINAMLDEERLVPTNCMRACTAVVTEISYNHEQDPYRAEIDFISASDWKKELEILFQDLLDGNGNVSRDCSNEDTDAGVAYAKIKAVYPRKTKEEIAKSSMEKLMDEVSDIVGGNRKINETDSKRFYRRLQFFVDSKEKSTGEKDKNNKKDKREREFWPLIRVVRIYVKSPALATGAVIVDLPGVHDSNAARAAVAEGYMKECTGLWIVAPINRAVDDKAAKSLLGESFKRQLKMDGGFDSVTFICSKTDDISITEAQDSLGLDEEMIASWERMATYTEDKRRLESDLKDLKESKAVFGEIMGDADDELEVWEKLKDKAEAGETVHAPPPKVIKKRKKGHTASKGRKRLRSSRKKDESDDSENVDSEDDDSVSEESAQEESSHEKFQGKPLTEEQIIAKITELRSTKKNARQQRTQIEEKMTSVRSQLEEADVAEKKIESEQAALCIAGRNQYSKGAIQQDFAAGIKELDHELAAEEDEDNFNPEAEVRDYEEVARGLPVFCISSRAYQKLQGRLSKDPMVPRFKTVEETEIPQLQAHCRKLTEKGRAANCQRFLNNLSQLLNSLTMWAAGDGTGRHLTADQKAGEAAVLAKSLKKLESALENVIRKACNELREEFGDNIYDRYETAIGNATEVAAHTAAHWGAPVNRDDRAAGGICWAVYKAICRRNGIYTNAYGPHEWNVQLADPMLKVLASGWERTFSRRTPAVMQNFSRNASSMLRDFHRDVDARARKIGASLAGLHMLSSQIRVYDDMLKDLSNAARDAINTQQKDINREFTPVIEKAMQEGYVRCVDESGPGSFKRMKAHMETHVEQERSHMFRDAAEEIKKRLKSMTIDVNEMMSNRADEVFIKMSRDYQSVIGGADERQGEVIPKWERLMKNDVMQIIESVERIFRKVVGLEVDGEVGNGDDIESFENGAADEMTRSREVTLEDPRHDSVDDGVQLNDHNKADSMDSNRGVSSRTDSDSVKDAMDLSNGDDRPAADPTDARFNLTADKDSKERELGVIDEQIARQNLQTYEGSDNAVIAQLQNEMHRAEKPVTSPTHRGSNDVETSASPNRVSAFRHQQQQQQHAVAVRSSPFLLSSINSADEDQPEPEPEQGGSDDDDDDDDASDRPENRSDDVSEHDSLSGGNNNNNVESVDDLTSDGVSEDQDEHDYSSGNNNNAEGVDDGTSSSSSDYSSSGGGSIW